MMVHAAAQADPLDTEVHRKLGRQVSPVDEEEQEQEEEEEVKPLRPSSRAAHNKHGGGGGSALDEPGLPDGGQDPDALDPDDQLMTLDELAAEVEQQDEKSEEDEGAGEEKAGAGQADADADGGGGGRRRRHKTASDGGGAHSHAATTGGTMAGRHKRSSAGDGGGADDASSVMMHAGVDSSGISRGRRLKRLLKLLSGQKASPIRLLHFVRRGPARDVAGPSGRQDTPRGSTGLGPSGPSNRTSTLWQNVQAERTTVRYAWESPGTS